FDASGTSFRRGLEILRGGRNGVEPRPGVQAQAAATATYEPPGSPPAILKRVDLSLKLDQKIYERELKRLQATIYLLGLEVYRQRRPVALVFEGWDAAGKGGAIKRVTEKLDPRAYV